MVELVSHPNISACKMVCSHYCTLRIVIMKCSGNLRRNTREIRQYSKYVNTQNTSIACRVQSSEFRVQSSEFRVRCMDNTLLTVRYVDLS